MHTLEQQARFTLGASLPDAEPVPLLGGTGPVELRQAPAARSIGRLVSLNGARCAIDCRLDPAGEDWSIGHLITISQQNVRLVGVISELAAVDPWVEDELNRVRASVEIHGEIVEGPSGRPVFTRGIRSYPPLGASVHRIRADDLRAIYAFRGRGAEIGRLSQNFTVSAEIGIDELIGRHFAVVGMTGVGKTSAVSMLVARAIAARPNLRVLILDPHNEYPGHFPSDACVIDSNDLELPVWMFRFDELSNLIFNGRAARSDELDALYEIIQLAKTRYVAEQAVSAAPGGPSVHAASQLITPDTPSPFRCADAVDIIDEWLGKLEKRYATGDLRALRSRIDGLSRDPRFQFMFSGADVDIEKVVSKLFRIPKQGLPITIVELAGLPNEVTNSVVSVLARLAFEISFWCCGQYEVSVVCEEAHRYIPLGDAVFEPARRALRRIAREGRKYGVTLGVVSPRPSELDPTVLSQCSTTFAMRLANEIDKNIIREALGASAQSMIELLPSIADREAIAFGEAVAMPMRMKFLDRSHRLQDRRAMPDAAQIDLGKLAKELEGGESYRHLLTS